MHIFHLIFLFLVAVTLSGCVAGTTPANQQQVEASTKAAQPEQKQQSPVAMSPQSLEERAETLKAMALDERTRAFVLATFPRDKNIKEFVSFVESIKRAGCNEGPLCAPTGDGAKPLDTGAIIPEDPQAAKIRFSEKTFRYDNKTIYVRDQILTGRSWIDESRYLASKWVKLDSNFKTGGALPKIVIVDIRTGEIEDTGYEGEINCYTEGRIATRVSRMIRDGSGKSVAEAFELYGELGSPLKAYKLSSQQEKELELNTLSCKLVPKYNRQSGKRIFPLKVEHGVIYEIQPENQAQLRLGQDEKNRIAFYREGGKLLPRQVYWERPDGTKVEIPFNPGEVISFVRFVPFENAYVIAVSLNNSQSIKSWNPRFVRLLYQDGSIKLIGVPNAIFDLVKQGKVVAEPMITKRGIVWRLLTGARDEEYNMDYLTTGVELIKMHGRILPGFDGCKLFGSEKHSFFSSPTEYFFDICKGE